MSQNYDLIHGRFQHVILEGTAYEVGKMQGEIFRNREKAVKFYSSFEAELGSMGFHDLKELVAAYEEHCPGLLEEVQGLADGLGVEIEKIPFYRATYHVPKKCSQIAVLSSATRDERVYVGRSYEWIHTDEDLRLCTTRVKKKAKHIGFSGPLFGRLDGMNEHGLSVTFTGGGIFGVPLDHEGFFNWLVIRSILDNCKSVDDATKMIKKIPVSGFFSFLIVDKNSNAALIEYADGAYDIKRVNNDSPDKYLISTNHYTLPATTKFNEHNCGIIENSQKRYQLLASTLKNATPEINKETIRTILSKKFPEGVCDHYYSDSFGTLWSMIFDLTSAKAEICFGAPTHNEWREFTLDEPVSVKEYTAIFPDNKS